jgi:PTS system glucose-specific IIC component
MFLFVAPWLYVIHSFLDGLSFYFADIMNIRIGNSFSGGLIDYLLFGVLQGQDKTHWMYVIPFGLAWAVIYYLVFRFCIAKFKVAIPGMEVEADTAVAAKPTFAGASDLSSESMAIIEALGGDANIQSVEACATRLRVAVKDAKTVDKGTIKDLGATAVLEMAGGVQAVFGGKADLYSQEINQLLGRDE